MKMTKSIGCYTCYIWNITGITYIIYITSITPPEHKEILGVLC